MGQAQAVPRCSSGSFGLHAVVLTPPRVHTLNLTECMVGRRRWTNISMNIFMHGQRGERGLTYTLPPAAAVAAGLLSRARARPRPIAQEGLLLPPLSALQFKVRRS